MEFAASTISSASTSPVLEDAAVLLLALVISPSQRSRKRPVAVSRTRFSAEGVLDRVSAESVVLFSSKSSKHASNKNGSQHEASDDDTASTVSATSAEDEEEDASFFSLSHNNSSSSLSSCTSSAAERRRVSFASNPVTDIRYRPLCTEDDKYYLHYSEHDYIDFKLDYLTKGNSPLVRKTPRKVGFAREVVTSTHDVLGMDERLRLSLYYNEYELQRFLDDFVASLQKQQHFGQP